MHEQARRGAVKSLAQLGHTAGKYGKLRLKPDSFTEWYCRTPLSFLIGEKSIMLQLSEIRPIVNFILVTYPASPTEGVFCALFPKNETDHLCQPWAIARWDVVTSRRKWTVLLLMALLKTWWLLVAESEMRKRGRQVYLGDLCLACSRLRLSLPSLKSVGA